MDDFYVYLLLDPRKNNEPFYIGKGRKLRYRQHLARYLSKKDGNRLKQAIIGKIRDVGLEPVVEFAARELTEDEAILLECTLICQYGRRDLGHGPLTNLTNGGEGTAGHLFTPERCQKISRALTGKRATEAQRQAQSEAAKRRSRSPMTEETKEKIRQKALGRKHSEKTKQKIGNLQRGLQREPRSAETKEKISAAQRGRPGRSHETSTATRLKISIALTGKRYGPLTENQKRKLSEALTGKPKPPFSEEHRRKIGVASAGRKPSEAARENMRAAHQKRRQAEEQHEIG